VGDFGFLFGILGFLFFSYPMWSSFLATHPDMAMLSFRALPAMTGPVMAQAGPALFTTIAILLFMGPMAKSAQVPLHTWLPDAMEGPTPISALIHAATMVAAGVYLVGRAYPIFHASEHAMLFVAIIGTLTAVIGATIALTQYDIKKALAYSTMSQLGFMVAAMGVGAFTAGLFHLFTHAFFKAMLFLCSGSVIHACEDEQDMRQMGGLAKKLPVTHLTYLIGTLAISGLLWTSGFWSKDEILAGAKEYAPWVYWSLFITAGMTAFYMFRTYFLTFLGKYRGKAHVHHEDPVMTTPLLVLAVPSLLIGLLMAGLKDIHILPAFGEYISYGHPHEAHHTFIEAITSPIGIQSTIIGLIGFALSVLFYVVNPGIPEKIKTIFAPLFTLFSKKWYFDEFYKGFVDKVYLAFADASASFDRGGIDGLVNWTGRTVVGAGYGLRQLQSGQVQSYIAILFFSVVVLSLLLFYWLM
jgi:proton-translocating NADH-quinone oxidoreductase chain L